MPLSVSIKKKLPGFTLEAEFGNPEGTLGILGASGCGKSMTLKCIAGILKPDEGRIEINGRVVFDSRKNIDLPAQERKVGYLFQNYALFPTMTVLDNIMAGMKGKQRFRKEKAMDLASQFRLKGLEQRYPSQLSGGQQQRCALARMLAAEPEVLLLDEPFSALDSYLKDALQEELLDVLSRVGRDAVLVSHSRDEIYKFSNRLLIMADGRGREEGSTKDLFEAPVYMESARLTGCKNISPVKRLGEHELIALNWGIRLRTERAVDSIVRYVGIRAHYLKPASEPGTNRIPFRPVRSAEEPFEMRFLTVNPDKSGRPIDSTGSGAQNCFLDSAGEYDYETLLWWKISRETFEKDMGGVCPAYLELPADKLLLLR